MRPRAGRATAAYATTGGAPVAAALLTDRYGPVTMAGEDVPRQRRAETPQAFEPIVVGKEFHAHHAAAVAVVPEEAAGAGSQPAKIRQGAVIAAIAVLDMIAPGQFA